MARYIDADKLVDWCKETFQVQSTVAGKAYVDAFLTAVCSCPTADVAPRAEVAREIFEEIEKIIEKHHSECYEYEDGDECDTAITYISYLSVDIDDLKKKYTEGQK